MALYNVSRFTDIGRLTAYFKKHIAANFELEDLDTCTSNLWTSNVCKLTLNMAGFRNFCENHLHYLVQTDNNSEAPEVVRRL